MKTKILLGAGIIGAGMLTWAASPKDPVIMTVNGVDVPKSEFEYLYHKNAQQQLAAQPIDEYVNLFVNYRLKVADAMAEGVDTTAAFRQEMAQYRRELAAPYMADSVLLNRLVDEAYERSKEEVNTSHIMIFQSRNDEENKASIRLLDSLKNVLKNGGDFADLASRYSQDRGSAPRGGELGFITAGRFPYSFEKAAFALKPGEVSDVVDSRIGYHLIKANDRRPSKGQVRVAHILLFDQSGDHAASAAVKARIDSIYAEAKADPSKFEDLARQYSDDKGSARQGGALNWFGSGQMVQEFEDVAFNLPVKSLSEPFRSQFGWHIIYKYDQRSNPSKEVMKPTELQRIMNPQDQRSKIVQDAQMATLKKKHNAKMNEATLKTLKAHVAANGIDSTFYAPMAMDRLVLFTIGKKATDVAALKATLGNSIQPDKDAAVKYIDSRIESLLNRELTAAEEDWLEANNAEYRNLFHEYQNGSLLYEASVRNVWNRAGQDKAALEKYFADHRNDYAWQTPHAKGVLVQAKNDSIAADVARRYAELPKTEAVQRLKKEYKGEAQIDQILMSKGQNSLVDALMFGEGEPTPLNSNYAVCIMLDGRMLNAPETAEDVKGQLTSDFQEYLEESWLKQLRDKYPVVINQKVLKSVK